MEVNSQLSLRTLAGHKRVQQAGFLYLSKILGVGLAFVTSVIYTRTLGPNGYGDLKFINMLFEFLATISTLGLFVTAGQMIALMPHDDDKRSEFVGSVVFLAGLISSMLVIVTIVFCAVESRLFHSGLGRVIAIFSPAIAVFVFHLCLLNLLQGDNRIHELSSFILMRSMVLVIALAAVHLMVPLNLFLTLAIQLITGLAVSAVLVGTLHPRMSNLALDAKLIWSTNRKFGWHVYVGILAGVATGYISTFTISYFLDNTRVGFYSLGLALAFPLAEIPSVAGTTYFKDFSNSARLPTKVTVITIVVSLVTLIAFLLVIKPLVLIVYTDKFVEVVALTRILAFGTVLEGFGNYLNRFLMAHGRGKELRNVAIAVGCVNVLGFLILVKLLGVEGAAITYVLSRIIYVYLFILYYRRFSAGGLTPA